MMTMAICLYKYYFNHVTDLKWPRDELTPTLIISDRQNQSLIICGAGRMDYLYRCIKDHFKNFTKNFFFFFLIDLSINHLIQNIYDLSKVVIITFFLLDNERYKIKIDLIG